MQSRPSLGHNDTLEAGHANVVCLLFTQEHVEGFAFGQPFSARRMLIFSAYVFARQCGTDVSTVEVVEVLTAMDVSVVDGDAASVLVAVVAHAVPIEEDVKTD